MMWLGLDPVAITKPLNTHNSHWCTNTQPPHAHSKCVDLYNLHLWKNTQARMHTHTHAHMHTKTHTHTQGVAKTFSLAFSSSDTFLKCLVLVVARSILVQFRPLLCFIRTNTSCQSLCPQREGAKEKETRKRWARLKEEGEGEWSWGLVECFTMNSGHDDR